jgi:hypothetical protein
MSRDTSSRLEPLVRGVEVSIETRVVRRCPVCRDKWPFDWEYCPHCVVWLPGHESADRLTRIVPVGDGSACDAPADVSKHGQITLAVEVRFATERPPAEDLRRSLEFFRSADALIARHAGCSVLSPRTGLIGRWASTGGSIDAAVRAAAGMLRTEARGGLVSRGGLLSVGIGLFAVADIQIGASGEVAVHAARLASLTNRDAVLVSSAVYERTRARFDYRGVVPVTPHSRPLPGPVFELVGAKAERSGSRASDPDRGPLTGRRGALRILDACLAEARSGHEVTLHLVGEPGVGKSRLLREWLAAADGAGRLGWLRLATDGVPYGGFERRAWQRLTAGWPATSKEPGAPARPTNSTEIASWLRETEGGALVVVDDLHWVDEASRLAIGELLREVTDLPVLAILAYRPSFTALARDNSAGIHREVRLRGLKHAATRELLQSLAGRRRGALSPTVLNAVLSHAGGNPLYLEEATAHLMEAEEQLEVEASRLPSGLPDLLIRRIQWTLERVLPDLEQRRRDGVIINGFRFPSSRERETLLADVETLEERLACWLDRLDVVAGEAPETRTRFLEGLTAIDGQLALLHVLLGHQRPHCYRLAQALERLRPS